MSNNPSSRASSLGVPSRDPGFESGPTVASLTGEYDIATVAALSETLAVVIASSDADLILDLRAVEFLDASTVGVLVRAEMLLGARSRSLVLRSPSRPALRVLDVCGLTDLLQRQTRDDRGP